MTRRTGGEHAFFAPCPRGLEPLLGRELAGLGASAIALQKGGVGFSGPFDLCYRVNLNSRIASRVLWRVFQGPYRHEEDVYRAARGLPWPEWFSNRKTIKVMVTGKESPLKSLDFVTLRIKDAVCDRFRADTRARPSVDTRRPDLRIDAFLDARSLIVYLDTSGEPLFKRGLRTAGSAAPLRENLAAGILSLSGWTSEHTLLDPMCGSGTFLMEAAQIALGRAPGLGRRFAFEHFKDFDKTPWDGLCAESRAHQRVEAPLGIYGSDVDGAALEQAMANLQSAGLSNAVSLNKRDVLDARPPTDAGILVMNPPYGCRTGKAADLAALYPRLGDTFKQHFPGWCAYLFTADLQLPKLIGLRCSRRTPLFNGPIECRLFEFKLVRGSWRQGREGCIAEGDPGPPSRAADRCSEA